MWNFYSLPKWTYTIPYVGFWHVFEMPLLGYLGYLPFGIVVFAYAGLALKLISGENLLELFARAAPPHKLSGDEPEIKLAVETW